MASDSKRNLRNSTNLCFRTVYNSSELTVQVMQYDVKMVAHELESGDKNSALLLLHGHGPTLAPPKYIARLLIYARLRVMIQPMAGEKAERIYTGKVREAMPEQAENGLSDAPLIGIEFANDGLRSTSFHIRKRVVTEAAQNDGLETVFNRNVKRWTQLSTSKDAFEKRVLTSSRFVHPTSKFNQENPKEQFDAIDQKKSARVSPFHFLKTPSLSSRTSENKL